jgi:multidrug efflux system outer membrane protein
MSTRKTISRLGLSLMALIYSACSGPSFVQKKENKNIPVNYSSSTDTVNSAKLKWKDFFTDVNLNILIDSALKNNQEFNIVMQEINISKNEIRARKGQYLPFLNIGAGAAVEKVGRYTSQGASDANNEIMPGKKFPDPLPNFMFGATASWEIDIWKKLRNSKKSAVYRYLSSVEGRNFMATSLIAEIANSYYELMALDNQLEILKRNIAIQQNALEMVKLEKIAAKVTELAVRKFEAEVFKNQSRQFQILQNITVTENRINFLVGRFPQAVIRNSQNFIDLVPKTIQAGISSQLLENRPDIRQAEQNLAASKLDVKIAKSYFYPSLMISAGVGYRAFNPKFLLNSPESMLYSVAGDLVAPLINRNAIKAFYYSSSSRQVQTVYNYERTILRAYIEVANQLSNISNLEKSYDLKTKQVKALTQSIDISTGLFKSARADYMEVLLTQRDALDSRFELIETKKQQMNAMVNVYQALGGGWR